MNAPGAAGGVSKAAAAGVSIAYNATLIALKVAAAIVTGSVAILSEALNSTIDLVASVIAFVAVRRADEPADVEHPYGHEKVENVAASIEGVLIIGGAVFIIVESIGRLVNGNTEVESLGLGIAVIAFSTLSASAVSLFLRRQARKHDSPALQGDAAHLGADALTSAGVLIALALVQLTGAEQLDAAVAIVFSGFIIFTGLNIIRRAAGILVDEAPPPEEMDRIEAAIARAPGRRAGGGRLPQAACPDHGPSALYRASRPVPERDEPGESPRAGARAERRDRGGSRQRRGADPRRAGELPPRSGGVARQFRAG